MSSPSVIERGARVLASMSRRVRALLIAGVLFIVLFILAVTLPVPYVILSPGPTCNTLGKCTINGETETVIGISGRAPNTTPGHLNLTTVNESTDSINAFQAFWAWLSDDRSVVPKSSVDPPGQSEQQTTRQNQQDFANSQDDATTAALCYLGYPEFTGVSAVQSGSAAAKAGIKPGDRIASVDGKAANTPDRLRTVLAGDPPGTIVTVAVQRSGKELSLPVTLGRSPDATDRGGFLGIGTDPLCVAPFKIDLGLGNQIGGPSAGLMFALGIIDKIGKVDLTGGRFIAGTGEIDPTGQVSVIGGIQLKMIAARNAGATIFLAPAGNCSDVRGAIPKGLQVIKVSNLEGALNALASVRRGGHPAGC